MDNLKGKRILIFQQRGWAKRIGHFLAERLQGEGCKLTALTLKRLTHDIITKQKIVKYEFIINIDDIFEDPQKFLENETITLEEICKDLNIDSVWPMMYSNRLFTRSYKDKFFYSFKQNVSDEFIIAYIKAYYKVLRDLFNKFKPDAIFMAAFVYEGHIMLNLFANKYNIPIIAITDSRIPGHYIFTNDYLDRKAPLFRRFNELEEGKIESNNASDAKKLIKEFRQSFKKPAYHKEEEKLNLWQKIKFEIIPYKQVVGWYVKRKWSINLIKSIGPSTDYKPPKIILRDHYSKKKYKKFAVNFPYYDINKVRKFIFYPLQFTPEGSIDLTSPLFSNQIESARQIAMSLPDDYTLVVKEHPAMLGYRSPSFLEKINRTPNVKLVDYRIPSEKLIKEADLIISPAGTVIFESAFYRKPVILLSDVGIYKLLPNVFKHTDMTTLSKKIKELLKVDFKTEKYEKQLENYIAAVYDVGFSVNYRSVWYDGLGKPREKLIELFIREIERNLLKYDIKKDY